MSKDENVSIGQGIERGLDGLALAIFLAAVMGSCTVMSINGQFFSSEKPPAAVERVAE